MKKLKYWVRDYFGFSKTETNGFVVLLSLMVLMILVPFFYKHFFKPSYIDRTEDQAMLDSLIRVLEDNAEMIVVKKKYHKAIKPFPFDPNEASVDKLKRLGFKPWIAERIKKYRDSGGSFQQKSDLLKIYDISKALYDTLYTYIDLPVLVSKPKYTKAYKAEKPLGKPKITKLPKKETIELFDINKADSLQLKKIRGIGPVFSVRIIKYRNLVGGFISEGQYKEVYGLEPEVIGRLKAASFIEKDFIPQKINVNTMEEEELARHPYITYQLAKLIVAYRVQHGPFTSLEDLKKIKLVDEETFLLIEGYIAI